MQCVKSTAKFGGLATIWRGLCPPRPSVEPPLLRAIFSKSTGLVSTKFCRFDVSMAVDDQSEISFFDSSMYVVVVIKFYYMGHYMQAACGTGGCTNIWALSCI